MSAIAFRRHSLLFCSLSRKSRALTTSATDAANDLLSRYQGKTQSRSQYLEAHQIQKLSLALHRNELYPNISVASTPPKDGTPIPPGYHLVYFTPAAVEAELGADGSDRTFNPSAPFTRRMWAGGKIKWERGNKLQVGQQVEERTTLVAATAKKSRSGHEMLLVDVEKQLWNKNGLSVVDQRSWIFQPENQMGSRTKTVPSKEPVPVNTRFQMSEVRDVVSKDDGQLRRHFRWSPLGLFRFSALTYNAHLLHYADAWCREVEDFPGLIVHGPLNLINMMDYWRDTQGKDGQWPKEVTYRALSPLFVQSPYEIAAGQLQHGDGNEKNHEILVSSGDGIINMSGKILSE